LLGAPNCQVVLFYNFKLVNMENITQVLQFIVGAAVFFVWTFRIHNVIREFKLFGFNEIQRSLIGATKLALSTLLIVGIWHVNLVFIPACLMAFFMIGAQYYHYKIRDAFIKYIPSFVLLFLCLIIVMNTMPL
jgi:hypothetical protein